MPFQGILTNLVHNVHGSMGAVMSDYEGEPVAEAIAASGPLDRFDIQLLGAQLRSSLNHFHRVHEQVALSLPQSICIRGEDRSFFIRLLEDQYFVLLAVKNGAGLADAEYQLALTADLIIKEM